MNHDIGDVGEPHTLQKQKTATEILVRQGVR